MSFEVVASGYELVEGPTEEPDGGMLFSDALGGGVHRAAPDGSVATVVPKRRGVGGIALHHSGGVVVSGRNVVHVRDGESRTLLDVEGAAWNDLCTDSAGRVYAGALRFAVFDPEATAVPGELCRIDVDGSAKVLYGDVIHANGVALSPDERTIFHSDTRAREVVVHDLDPDDGVTTNRRAIDTSEYGMPDGLAFDEHGALWVALIGGGIGRFTPDGVLDSRLDVPSPVVTSLCFAGADRRDLYVTTAGHEKQELKGCLLRTRVQVAGAPVYPARV